jgi:hypothetical protein
MTLFISCGFILLAALSLFISFLARPHSRLHSKIGLEMLIGIRTSNTMASRQAWLIAHKAAAPYFWLTALYFAGYGAAVLTQPVLQPHEEISWITIGALLFGVALFLGATAVGDRAAKAYSIAIGQPQRPQPEVMPQAMVRPPTPPRTTLMNRPLNPLDYD